MFSGYLPKCVIYLLILNRRPTKTVQKLLGTFWTVGRTGPVGTLGQQLRNPTLVMEPNMDQEQKHTFVDLPTY